jgi:hypothetical protein
MSVSRPPSSASAFATVRHEALRVGLLFLGSGRHPNVNVSVKGSM